MDNIIRGGKVARGCDLCLRGAKSVIFITGLCPLKCFYCPVSRDRFGRDVMYVNDVPVQGIEDIVREVDAAGSVGAAITGGDPSVVAERVAEVARALKDAFGRDFHIHMYTHALNLSQKAAEVLAASSVDEVRVHAVSTAQVMGREGGLRALKAAGKAVGLEVPAVPGLERHIVDVMVHLHGMGLIDFVNLNELDASEGNLGPLRALGLSIDGAYVRESLHAAERMMRMAWDAGVRVPMHFCRSKVKDLAQIGARLFRQAMLNAAPYEDVLADGSRRDRRGNRIVIKYGARELSFDS